MKVELFFLLKLGGYLSTMAITATCFKAEAAVDGDKLNKILYKNLQRTCLISVKWDTMKNSIKFIWFVLDFCPLLPLNSKMQIESLVAGYLNTPPPTREPTWRFSEVIWPLRCVIVLPVRGPSSWRNCMFEHFERTPLLDCVLHYWLSTLEEPQSVLFCVFGFLIFFLI